MILVSSVGTMIDPRTKAQKRTRKFIKHSKLTKKRIVNHDSWSSVQKKKAVDSGKELLEAEGNVVVRERSMKKPCDISCRFKCMEMVTNDDRAELFEKFWDLKDHSRQWNFLNNLIKVKKSPNQESDCSTLNASDNENSLQKSVSSLSSL